MHIYACALIDECDYPGKEKSVMKHTSSTRPPRTKRVTSIVGLSIFFLLMALTMNVNGLSKLADAAALKPVTTQAPTPTPTPAPFVFITSPPNHSLYTLPTQIPITATATGSNTGATITRIEFYSTSLASTVPTLLGTATSAPYTVIWTPTQASIYTLTAISYDSLGVHKTSNPISVTVEMPSPPPPMPIVAITSPANNTVVGQYTSLPITASFSGASLSTITKVEFYASLNGSTPTLIGTATTAPYTITWTVQLANTLTAKAYDLYGQVETSAPVTIIVPVRDPIPLRVTLTSPLNNAVYSTTTPISITASVVDPDPTATITHVDFYDTPLNSSTSTLIGTATTAPYTITWTTQPGTYTLVAKAYDNYPGDYGISSVTITVTRGTPTPPPAYCKVNYTVSSQWPGGFSANITITNTGTTVINGWTLAFTFPGNQQITNLWNGTESQSGQQVTITNANWNRNIAVQGTVNVGFNASWTGSNSKPSAFTLNGHTCS
jgi:Cellulose binding domain/Bacterial Ig domain